MFCTTMDATIQHNRTNLRNVDFKPTLHPAMIINILLWVVPVLLIINFQTRQMWISFKMQDLFQLIS